MNPKNKNNKVKNKPKKQKMQKKTQKPNIQKNKMAKIPKANKKIKQTQNNIQDNNKISKKVKKTKFSKKHPKIALTIKLSLVLILIAIVITAGIAVGMLYGMWGDDFEITEEELMLNGNSVIYDSEGNVLAELSGDENRKIIKLDEMAKYLPKAYIAIEDERFETHSGVDYKRTLGAIATYITHRGSSSYGGSTITQQLVKNMTDAREKNGVEGITRKIKEWAKAFKIEKMLSKDQILELYLNVIFVGDKNYGVEMGAQYYFNKNAKDLNLAECAFLAGINNRPNYYNPYGKTVYGKDETKTKEINNRTKTVLGKMLELGYINQEEYDKAISKVEKGLKFKKGTQNTVIYSYHTDATISQVIKDFMNEKGWTEEYAKTYVYGGGLKIYSTQNTKVQEKMEKVMSDNASSYQISSRKTKDSDGKYVKSQSAMVVIDNDTGYVAGVVGGLGKKTESRGFNRATQGTRSTGSSIKPIADLLPGVQEGLITAATRYMDNKTDFNNGKYSPKNDGSVYFGNISVRAATAVSHNIPFVKIMAEVTNPVSTSYLKKMGITSLDDEKDTGLALAIGGLTNGISPLEMAGAYATIANDGVYRTPLFYTKIVDSEGNNVLEPKQETREVCSKQTAYVIKNILTSVIKGAQGRGGTASYCSISGMDVACKTGTSNANKDRWLCGLTNYYTAATWYGYDVEEEVKIYGTNPAGRIWSAVMKSLHSDKKSSRFEKPSGVVTASVCSKTGLRASKKCSSTYQEIFVAGTIPEYCDESGNSVDICKESGKVATEYCPETTKEYYSYTLPKERLKLWKTYGSTGGKAPTEICTIHNEDTAKESAKAPKISLIGSASMTLNVGDSYIEKGATAKDKKDGDLTSKIQISGNVNTSKAGTYTVKYTVKNSSDKTSTVTRTIIVKDNSATPSTPSTPSTNTTNTTNTSGTDKPSTPEGGNSTSDKPGTEDGGNSTNKTE